MPEANDYNGDKIYYDQKIKYGFRTYITNQRTVSSGAQNLPPDHGRSCVTNGTGAQYIMDTCFYRRIGSIDVWRYLHIDYDLGWDWNMET